MLSSSSLFPVPLVRARLALSLVPLRLLLLPPPLIILLALCQPRCFGIVKHHPRTVCLPYHGPAFAFPERADSALACPWMWMSFGILLGVPIHFILFRRLGVPHKLFLARRLPKQLHASQSLERILIRLPLPFCLDAFQPDIAR